MNKVSKAANYQIKKAITSRNQNESYVYDVISCIPEWLNSNNTTSFPIEILSFIQ